MCDKLRVSSANMVKAGTYQVNNMQQIVEERSRRKQEEETRKLLKAKEAYDLICSKSDDLIKNKPDRNTWTAADYKTVLKPYKTRDDGAMPNKLNLLKDVFGRWILRPKKKFDIEESSGSGGDAAAQVAAI